MRLVPRVLATTVAALAMAAAGVVGATPAAATPEDGKGCVGVKGNALAYVCVISVTPENALPSVSANPINVPVPSVCYFLECTAAQTVSVPVPGATPGSGVVAVYWYQGQYKPIAVGTTEVMKVVTDTVTLANNVVDDTVLPTVTSVLNSLPTTGEVVQAAYDEIDWALGVADPYLQTVWREYGDAMEAVNELYYYINNPYQLIYDLPYYDTVIDLYRAAYCAAQEATGGNTPYYCDYY